MVKPRKPDVAIVASPLVAFFAAFLGFTISFGGCGVSSGRHFGSDDADVSTGRGDSSHGDTGGVIGFRGMPASGGAEQSGGTAGGSTASGGSSSGGAGSSNAGSASGGGGSVVGSGGRPGDAGSSDTPVEAPSGRDASDALGTGGGGGGGSGGIVASGGMTGTGGGSGGAGTGGANTGGANTGGANTGGANTGGANTGGANTGGANTGGANTGGANTGGANTGGAGTGGAGTGGAGTGGAEGTCRLTVNEIQTGTALGATDEFVELYNSCAVALNLSGYSLNYRSAGNNTGGADIALFVFPNASEVSGYGFVVLASAAFDGPAAGRWTGGGLAALGGAVAIRNASGAIVDAVAYEVLTTANFFTEAVPAATPPLTSSIVRVPDGTDSDNNSRDFRVSLVATPGASNR